VRSFLEIKKIFGVRIAQAKRFLKSSMKFSRKYSPRKKVPGISLACHFVGGPLQKQTPRQNKRKK
jgi:hypothetical protein